MGTPGIIFIIVLFVLYALIFGKSKKTKKKKDKSSASTGIKVTVSDPKVYKGRVDSSVKKMWRYMAETVPALLDDYHIFVPSFYSRYAARYLKDGRTTNITKDDLIEGVSYNEALWTLSHCEQLASARFHAIGIIENAPEIEVKFIDFEVWRPNPDCPRVPKNKVYDVDEDIPIFPCADCKEEKICIFNYKNVF